MTHYFCPWCHAYFDMTVMVRPRSKKFDFFVCRTCRDRGRPVNDSEEATMRSPLDAGGDEEPQG